MFWKMIDIDKGLYVHPCGEIVISVASPVWDLPPGDIVNKLIRAKVAYIRARALDRIETLREHEYTECCLEIDGVSVDHLLCGIIENELLPDDARDFAEEAYAEISSKLASGEHRQKLRRSASKWLRLQVIKRDGRKCRYCGRELHDAEIYLDHVIPYSLGGLTEINNLVVSCFACNAKKGGRMLEETGMKLLEVDA